MGRGEPGLPEWFLWRDREVVVAEVLEVWKESRPERHTVGELYLRKHWYRIRADDGSVLTIYFERQARVKSQAKKRWWLYTIAEASPPA